MTDKQDPRMGEGRDVFRSVAAAERRARQIGCTGTHTLRTPDGNYYMPCESHSIYLRITEDDKSLSEEEFFEKKLSPRMEKTLKGKMDEHNEEHGDKAGKRVNMRMLRAVFRRGVGAYRTNPESVRRSVMGPDQWAIARVNAFLYAVRNNRYRSGQFDRDLLPKDHPLYRPKGKE